MDVTEHNEKVETVDDASTNQASVWMLLPATITHWNIWLCYDGDLDRSWPHDPENQTSLSNLGVEYVCVFCQNLSSRSGDMGSQFFTSDLDLQNAISSSVAWTTSSSSSSSSSSFICSYKTLSTKARWNFVYWFIRYRANIRTHARTHGRTDARTHGWTTRNIT